MSEIEDSEWGRDEWLMDRNGRRRWLRSISLHHLAGQILRTAVGPEAAVSCVLDEVFADAAPLPRAKIARCVREDVRRFGTWLHGGVTRGSRVASSAKTVAVLVPDGAPYTLQLALAKKQPQNEEWPASIAWRASKGLVLVLLDQLLPRTKKLGANIQRDADYILPLAYSAFLLRGALRKQSRGRARRGAVVSYDGGDNLIVPAP